MGSFYPKSWTRLVVAVFFGGFAADALAQPACQGPLSLRGSIDYSFQQSGYNNTPPFEPGEIPYVATLRTHTNRLQHVGTVRLSNEPLKDAAYLAQYTVDGELDLSFGNAGKALLDLRDDRFATATAYAGPWITAAVHDGAGRTVLAGQLNYTQPGVSTSGFDALIVRILPSGEIDRTFGDNGLLLNSIPGSGFESIKIIAEGTIQERYLAATGKALYMFDTNGSPVTSFAANGSFDFSNWLVLLDDVRRLPGGKLLLTGMGTNVMGPNSTVLIGLTAQGALDTSFGPSANGVMTVSSLAWIESKRIVLLTNQSKMLIFGRARNGDGRIVKLSFDGVIDTSFGSNGAKDLPFAALETINHSWLPLKLIKSSDGLNLLGGIVHIPVSPGSTQSQRRYRIARLSAEYDLSPNWGKNGYVDLIASEFGGEFAAFDNAKVIFGGPQSLNGNFFIQQARVRTDCMPELAVTAKARKNGLPQANVMFRFGALEFPSNAQGTVTFPMQYGTPYTITPILEGHSAMPSHVTGVAQTNAEHEFALLPNRYSLSGTVKIGSHVVFETEVDGGELGQQLTTHAGFFEFSNIEFGTSYSIRFRKPGYRFTPDQLTGTMGGNLVVMIQAACDTGYVEEDNRCIPAAPTSGPADVRASDGTVQHGISVTWSSLAGASTYKVYRSEKAGELGREVRSTSLLVFEDMGVTGGKLYYYTVTGVNSQGEGPHSAEDSGYALAANSIPGDCDGDGIPDLQEIEDGTGVCDPESFYFRLQSPAFVKYNTFHGDNGMQKFNYLELLAGGETAIQAQVTIFDINGNTITSRPLTLNSQQQVDIDIHSIVGRDTYGLIRVDYDTKNGALLFGRLSQYLRNSDQESYSYALSSELRNPTRGVSFATANTFDPQGAGFLVPNWAEIINLEDTPQIVTFSLLDQRGEVAFSQQVEVPAHGERDIQAGHELGVEGVYIARFKPLNDHMRYLASVSRYSSNATSSTFHASFNFAMKMDSVRGRGAAQYLMTTNRQFGCSREQNWIELANVSSNATTVDAIFWSNTGAEIVESSVRLGPYQQFHLNASAVLGERPWGSVEIRADQPGAVVAQGAVYFHDCQDNRTQTAYLSSAKLPSRQTQIGTFNRFIGFDTELRLSATSLKNEEYALEIVGAGQMFAAAAGFLRHRETELLSLANQPQMAIPAQTLGTVKIMSEAPGAVIAESVRIKHDGREVDIAFATDFH